MVVPIAVSVTSEAYAASSGALESPAGVIETGYAAELMGVSTQQASADLALQHDALGYVQALQQSGDDVEYDNADATLHVYGQPSPATAPASVADRVVFESRPFQQTPFTGTATPAGCDTSADEYCSPVEGGVRVTDVDECTAGPILSDYYGNTYMAVAGHCAIDGDSIPDQPFTSLTWPGLSKCNVGNSTVSVDAPWIGYDIAIEPASTGTCGGMTPYIHDWEFGTNIPQQGAVNAAKGEVVCHRGITSLYACGVVQVADVESHIGPYSNGNSYWIKNTDRICMYGAPGDSGGTVSDSTYPGAITGTMLAVGSEPKCGGADTLSIEQQIFAILSIHNLYVLEG
jgi:hypothetical protein